MSDDMPEEWRPIPGHPDYEVSSLGRVRSWKGRSGGLILRGATDRAGYHRVFLDGVRYSTHRIVGAVFVGPCPPGKEVDHINNVRGDNRAVNIQYLTRAENLAKRENALATECNNGHPLTDDNLYVRPSTGRRECKTCTRDRMKNRPPSGKICSADGCGRVADCRLRTDRPLCEMHYQRDRTAAKKRRLSVLSEAS